MPNDDTALIPAPPTALEDEAPVPAYSSEQMSIALAKYRELQRVFDREMPNAIMTVGDKQFRKRAYWRAVSVAFKLTVEPTEERREVVGQFKDGAANFGYVVTYRATATNGRFSTGDGTCFAVEKAPRFHCPHPHPTWRGKSLHFPATTCPDYDPSYVWRVCPPEATEHNVRAHAHTRAYNRAVSNLVGFGEVSAEEAQQHVEFVEEEPSSQPPLPSTREPYQPPVPVGRPDHRTPYISEPQRKRMWAIAKQAGFSDGEIQANLKAAFNIEHTREITKSQYESVCKFFGEGPHATTDERE